MILEYLCIVNLLDLSLVCKSLRDVFSSSRIEKIRTQTNIKHAGQAVVAMDFHYYVYPAEIMQVHNFPRHASVTFPNFAQRWDERLTTARMRDPLTMGPVRLCSCSVFGYRKRKCTKRVPQRGSTKFWSDVFDTPLSTMSRGAAQLKPRPLKRLRPTAAKSTTIDNISLVGDLHQSRIDQGVDRTFEAWAVSKHGRVTLEMFKKVNETRGFV